MIGTKLRTLRESRELSREQVAAAIGISSKTYAKYENNEGYPPHKTIETIADY